MNRLLLFAALLCFGCKSLKQQHTFKQKEVSELETLTATKAELNSLNEYLWRDSNATWYKLEINPVGQFSFSNKNGFIGSASSIKLSGNQSQIQKLAGSQQLKKRLATITNSKETVRVKQSIKVAQKEKMQINSFWLWAGSILVLLCCCVWLRKKYTISLFKIERR